MKKANPFVWEGKTYTNGIRSAAKELGVHYATLSYWLSKGYTSYDDLEQAERDSAIPVMYQGVWYSSARQAAEKNGIVYSTMLRWMHNPKLAEKHGVVKLGFDKRRGDNGKTE